MSMNLIKLLPVVAALAISGLAQASTAQDIPSVVVKYGDLSLTSKAGIASLHARIRNAAESVCSPLNSSVLGLRDHYERCVRDAITQSVDAVNNGAKRAVVARN
jgi:UrcA family protein